MACVSLDYCQPGDPEWRDFVRSRPEATLFHHASWLNVINRAYGYPASIAVLRSARGSIAGGFPLLEVSTPLRRRRLVSLPFTDHCPPLVADEDTRRQLGAVIGAWARERAPGSIEIRDSLAGALQGVEVAVRHVLDISPERPPAYSRSVRWNIKKADREHVEVVVSRDSEAMSEFYRLHALNRRRLGVPVQPARFMQAVWSDLIQEGLGFVVVARHQSRAIAAAVFLAWNRTLLYKYSAVAPGYRHAGGIHPVLEAGIQWARERDYGSVDFGRTDLQQQGLRDFKSAWGADEAPLTYAYWPAIRRGLGVHQGVLHRALAKTIQNSPLAVCRALGEVLYRYAA